MFLYFAFSFLMGNKSLLLLHTIRSALFGLKKWSLITQFLSPITHHSSLKTPHPVWHHHSLVITQYFSTICGPHTCTLCSFYFLFFFLQPPVPKLTEPSEKKNPKSLNPVKKKMKKKKPRNQKEGKKKKEEGRIEDRTSEKKKEEELKTN